MLRSDGFCRTKPKPDFQYMYERGLSCHVMNTLFFSVNFEGSDKGSIGMDDNSCSAFDMNEDSNLTSINDGNNDDNEADNSYASNEDDDNDDNEIDDDENDEENNEDDGGDEDTQNGFEGDESNLVPSLGR